MRRGSAAPAAWAKRKGHLRFPFLFELLPFPCFLIWRRLPTCDRFETGVRQRIFSFVSFETCSQGQITFCYTCGLVSAGATYPCCATLWHVVTHGTYELSVWYNLSFAGPIYHNALTSCAALSCRALRRVNRLCSRTLSDTANMSRHGSTLCSPTVEKLLCRSLFSERSHVGNLRQTKKQRETGVKRVETAGVYPLVRPRGVSAHFVRFSSSDYI